MFTQIDIVFIILHMYITLYKIQKNNFIIMKDLVDHCKDFGFLL